MKAIIFYEQGGPEVLRYEDVPDPEPQELEVLVRVRASALNHLDLWLRRGIPGRPMKLPHISGCEGAGDVLSVGTGVTQFKPGDAVMITPPWSCGRCEYCLRNQDSCCLSFGMVGVQRFGCLAEKVVVPVQTLYPLPKGLTYEQAASIPLVFQTAWHMLVDRARLKVGEDVLIQAAGSGVGIAAIQIAKLHGARVFTTASTNEKLEKAKALGADVLINYKEKDFLEEIKNITNKRGVDVVFEHTGQENWEKNLLSLSRYGRLVTCGATSGPNAQMDLRYVYSRQLSILGSYMGGKRDLFDVLKFVDEGKLRPVIDSTYPLSETRKAQEKMEDRNIFGKIVVVPNL
jgi:NADPH:quinone reductase-like Zn-dependent oxidoreductase